MTEYIINTLVFLFIVLIGSRLNKQSSDDFYEVGMNRSFADVPGDHESLVMGQSSITSEVDEEC